jgi:hypothetical protein
MSSFVVIQRGSEGLLHLDAYGDRGFCIYGLLTSNSSDKRCRDEKIALVTGTNRLLGRSTAVSAVIAALFSDSN